MNISDKIKSLNPSDLNCNVFDVYTYDGLSMQELLCQFFTKINECINVSNETIDLATWLVNEGLKEEVAEKLMIWLDDGTLENIINVNVFNTLYNKIDKVEKANIYASVKNFGGIGNGVVDDTQAIQNAIDYANENGLVVLLNEGIYLSKSLSLYKNTSIVGENRTKSILKIHGDINGNLINLVDVDKTHINLENFTIDGNKENIKVESVNAIYTKQNTDTHHTIKNLIIHNVKGNGIVMSRGENIVTDLYIHHCDGYGILHVGSDNLFTNIRCAWNWKGGVYEGGASSRWISCKSFVNGEADNINKTTHNNEGYGFDIRDSKGATFIGCEAQENYSSGFRIMSYKQATLSSCRSDCNGMINKDVKSESQRVLKCYGVEIQNIQDCKIDIICDDFRFASGLTNLQWQYGALAIRSKECTNNIINISSSNMIKDIGYGWNENVDDEWGYYTNFVTNYKNRLILNQSILSSTILNSALRLKKDRFNTTRISFGDTTTDDFTWIATHETDNSFRLRLYDKGNLSNDYLQLFKTGGICVGKENIMLGFFGKSPVRQQTSVNNATDLNSAITLVNNLKSILTDLGLCK